MVAYVIVVPSLFLVTMLAAYVPARRAIPDSADTGAAIRVVQLVRERQIRNAHEVRMKDGLSISIVAD